MTREGEVQAKGQCRHPRSKLRNRNARHTWEVGMGCANTHIPARTHTLTEVRKATQQRFVNNRHPSKGDRTHSAAFHSLHTYYIFYDDYTSC